MARMVLPDSRFRSPTAVGGKADLRDTHVYSAGYAAHGGGGTMRLFANPIGQTIPSVKGSAIAATAAHQLTYTERTTNFTKAGELGSAIGDAGIRAIGIDLEQANISPTNTISGYGATPMEVPEILSKMFFQFKIASKEMIAGPIHSFPTFGGAYGNIAPATTANATTIISGSLTNGFPGQKRRLKLPLLLARTDTTEGVLGVAGSATLAFSVTSGQGQATLVTVLFDVIVKGDVR